MGTFGGKAAASTVGPRHAPSWSGSAVTAAGAALTRDRDWQSHGSPLAAAVMRAMGLAGAPDVMRLVAPSPPADSQQTSGPAPPEGRSSDQGGGRGPLFPL